jgi:hypothetical protein
MSGPPDKPNVVPVSSRSPGRLKTKGRRMNRIEIAAQNSTVKPLEGPDQTAPLATVALVGLGLAAAALGYEVGYNLGNNRPVEKSTTGLFDEQASSDDLLAARRESVLA